MTAKSHPADAIGLGPQVDIATLVEEHAPALGKHIRVHGDWAVVNLRRSTVRRVPRNAWQALQRTETLDGYLKWCLYEGKPHLRADIPWTGLPADRIRQVFLHTIEAVRVVQSGPASRHGADTRESDWMTADVDLVLQTLEDDHGWTFTSRADGTKLFDLSPGGVAGHAEWHRDSRHDRLRTCVMRDPVDPKCAGTDAAATFLLHCMGCFRGCRAVVSGGGVLALEANIPRPACPAEIGHALNALSLVLSTARPVVRAFTQDNALAKRYLAAGFSYARNSNRRVKPKSQGGHHGHSQRTNRRSGR